MMNSDTCNTSNSPSPGQATPTTGGATKLFPLGAVYATPGVLRHLAANDINPATLLAVHHRGDWGILDREDCEANAQAVKDGSRILSAYSIADAKVYVITEAADDSGTRKSTTLLLSSEY